MTTMPIQAPQIWQLLVISAFLCLAFFAFLVFCSPTPRPAFPSECQYRSIDSPELLQDIHNPSEATCSLSLIIPAWNESLRLPTMLSEALSHLESRKTKRSAQGLDGSYEVLLIDDGSTDGTSAAALAFAETLRGVGGETLRVVKLEKNRGKGGAVIHGMHIARGERILFADADGASKFSDLDKLEVAMDKTIFNGHALALGSRAHLVSTAAVVQRSTIRNLLMRSFHLYLHVLVGDLMKDTQCGFKLFSRSSARHIFPLMHVEKWAFDIEILLLARYAAIPCVEVPITWTEVQGSKMSLVHDSIEMALDLLVIRGNYAVRRWKAPNVVQSNKQD